MATPERPPRAAALHYRKGDTAPTLVASGRGHVADAILRAAEEAGIPVREDAALVEALAHLELGDRIPPELYQAVAEALAWAYRLTP
jgi:flagellar biosynthesis protein